MWAIWPLLLFIYDSPEQGITSINLTLHGVEISALVVILGFTLKQYGIYKQILYRVNIVWREYCKDHRIPYNDLGTDDFEDIQHEKHNRDYGNH
jgi:hypothetical protein